MRASSRDAFAVHEVLRPLCDRDRLQHFPGWGAPRLADWPGGGWSLPSPSLIQRTAGGQPLLIEGEALAAETWPPLR